MISDRRRLGLLVVAMSVLLAVIVPQATRAVSGTAQAAVIPGAPAVGDCLLQRISLRNGYETTTGFTAPTAQIAPCDGARFGEVVGLTPARGITRSERLQGCGASARDYLGAGDPADATGPWMPSIRSGVVLAGPDDLQRAAGQDWVACVVDLSPFGTDTDTGTYDGTARGGYDGGRLPSAFALCRSGRDVIDAADIPCTQAHAVEVLASTFDVPATAAATLGRTCDALARRLTRMPDVTAGGRLEVVVNSGYVGADGTLYPGADADGHVSLAQCLIGVVGPETLSGTVIGLGDAPVPWAG
ncbi:hypothetical protein JL107_07040 [Nakamurella flavida]|uniref:Septum formation-related domain-containing protein n=1 Tax=Nakamurella flavida TaxID=363630 RepID=A0A938YEH9_9ACTN|nr:hypothetical protein [Nakamurella flavida]MBM9476196.1 hypothetical protein [Nakamurella flavida]MDP9777059.1 hypothetical protein [Nakamurella flavida]